MKRYSLILGGIALFKLIACSQPRRIGRAQFPEITFIAWNEDTINSYRFGVLSNGRFQYSISRIGFGNEVGDYTGTVKDLADTITLLYDKNIHPYGLTTYLIKEISGRYLIQSFTTNRDRIFLRIRPSTNHW